MVPGSSSWSLKTEVHWDPKLQLRLLGHGKHAGETPLLSPYPEGCLSLPPCPWPSPPPPCLWWKDIWAPQPHLEFRAVLLPGPPT